MSNFVNQFKNSSKTAYKMEWAQFLTIVLSIFAMAWMIVFNTTAKIDRLDSKIDKLNENLSKESKDFHGRLCILEEKYRQIGEK
jgi:hypothetical protein